MSLLTKLTSAANGPALAAIGGALVAGWASAFVLAKTAPSFLAVPDGEELAVLDTMPSVGGDDGPASSPGRSPATSRKRSQRTYVDNIVPRSIFDSTKVGITAKAAPADGSERKSDLKVVLLATLVAEPAEYSSALIAEEQGSDGALGYGIGDAILGEGKIESITPRKVYIRRNDNSLEFIELEGGGYEKTGKKKKGKRGKKADDDSGVTKEGPNKFVIEQAVVDEILKNPEQLYKQVRAVPHKGADGQVDGYRLSGIRRRSFFYKLGVKNGDIIHSVNGKALDSMGNAMAAYESLQNDKNFTFEVTRRNNKQTFQYEIR
jgi:type II secretion system protein C